MSEKCLPTEKKKSFFPKKSKIDWRKVCRDMLDRSLPTSPLMTQPDAPAREDNNLNISLGFIEPQQQYPGTDGLVTADELAFSSLRTHIEQTVGQEQFLEQLQAGKSSSQGRRIAIIGESGTGKTTLLQKVAKWLLEKTDDVPIWITSSQLGTNLFDQYLRQKWLPQASQGHQLPPIEWQEAFEELLNSGRVWLLLDSVDERLLRLLTVAQQIRSWTQKVRIIITCRTYIWKNNRDALAAFDTYQTLELSYPEQITSFIENWFAPTDAMPIRQGFANAKATQESDNLGKKLLKGLEKPQKEQIRQAIKNPLRLALLCRLWQHHPQNLPDTKAELYQRLVPEFYQWKAEAIATNAQQQQALNDALEKLALRAMQEAKTFPDRFSHQLVTSVLGEDSPLLRVAIRLGWLQTIGAFAENSQEKYYTFFDTTFVQYFAARAVSDWQFFFARHLDKERQLNSSSESYRIFEPHWKQSILFWLGREDIALEDKEALIDTLLTFDDGCGCENFYGKRAYFLAAAGIAEFSDSARADEIIAKLVLLGFGSSLNLLTRPLAVGARLALQETHRSRAIASLIEIVQTPARLEIQELALASLEKIGKGDLQAKTALEEVLDTTQSQPLRWRVAECLGTIDAGNAKAIASAISLLSPSNSEETQQLALDSLEKIAKNDRRAIAMVINLIRTTQSALQRRAFECLETLAQGNASAIASLVQFIRTSKDEGMRRQIAESLEKLDPGNPTAIAVLIQLLQSAQTPEVRQQAVYSLGEISPGNLDAIAALVRLLQTSEDIFMRWVAVSSLGKIAADNQEAIDVLVTIIKSPDRSLLQKEAIDTLVKIQPNHPVAITALVKLMQYSDDEGIRREAAESLGKIDPTNPEAIAALSYLLRTSYDEFTCRQAAYSLGKIDPNNIDALKTLVRLIHMSREKDIRSLAAESLGEIGNNNLAAIATLIRLIQSTKDRDTLRRAIESLGKIAKGNRDAIAALMELLQSREDETIRLQTADSLIHLLQERQMMLAVSTLRDGFLYKSATSDLAAYNVMWYCAQRLPYPEFYQAWYFRPLPVQPESNIEADEDNGLNLRKETPEVAVRTVLNGDRSLASPFSLQLHRAINEHPQLSDRVCLIHVDSSQLLDRENPLVDIYDLMLAQNLPKFEYGVPDTMARLRLYWNSIRRTFPDRLFVLLLEEEWKKQGFSPIFLELLGKFEGLFGIVSDRPALIIQTFSPSDPELVPTIVTWIQTRSQDFAIDEIS
jgi:HEAT repeat protein/GTPase SAR1 family protein